MTTTLEKPHQQSAFNGGHFSIDRLSETPEGLTIETISSLGRTAERSLELTPEEKLRLAKAMPGEMKFRGVDDVREARTAWREAVSMDESAETVAKLKDEFMKRREAYIASGKKVSLRNLAYDTDPQNPDVVRGDAAITDFVTYNLFSTPDATGTLAEMARPTGVAMALITADNRLVIQHRASPSIDYLTSAKKPGNGAYGEVIGASVAGMADARMSSGQGRTPGTLDSVTNETFLHNILKEAGEEVGVGPEQITEPKIVGIAHDYVKPHSEVLLSATTALTYEQLLEVTASSKRNKNLSPADLAEKYVDIEASPEAIHTLLTEVKTPLPPTHSAVYIAAGHAMMLERSGKDAADAWLKQMEVDVAANYRSIDNTVREFYLRHPEAAAIVPERMWGKFVPERSLDSYHPSYTPDEQGLPDLEDELVRTGLVPETRQQVNKLYLFDVDGVLTDPREKRVTNPALFDEFIARLANNEKIALNTGRSTAWLENNFLVPLLERVEDPAILSNMICIGEKGGTWATIDSEKHVSHGKVESIALPAELKDRISRLVAEKYSDQMFFDETKQTMISVEMNDGGDIAEFQKSRDRFADDAHAILKEMGLEGKYRVDPTTIATDVESPYVSKALGARRFTEYLRGQDVAFAQASFEAFGDSPSDADMADELARMGLAVDFVFVGDPRKLTGNSEFYDTEVVEGYNQATLAWLAAHSAYAIR